MKSVIVVCEYGWILCGIQADDPDHKDEMLLNGASVVRRWTNNKGIGGLAKEENRDDYTLDPMGSVLINTNKILFVISCEW